MCRLSKWASTPLSPFSHPHYLLFSLPFIVRTHFLESYDSCEYGRCSIAPYDYAALQYWLFELHRGVTLRIYEQRLNDPITTKAAAALSGSTRAAIYDIYYPPFNCCPSCHKNTSLDNVKIQKNRVKKQGRTESSRILSVTDINDSRKKSILAYLEASYWHPAWVLEKWPRDC